MDRVRLLNLGADDYLVKPVDLVELDARVRAIVRRAAGDGKGAHEASHLAPHLYQLYPTLRNPSQCCRSLAASASRSDLTRFTTRAPHCRS
jgi:DNA-binding response OmpR family regulator